MKIILLGYGWMKKCLVSWWNKIHSYLGFPKTGSKTKSPLKKWTFLIYLNGQNDLRPEMDWAKSNLEKLTCLTEANLLVEIGRAPEELVHLLRPAYRNEKSQKCWYGVRRYQISMTGSKLIKKRRNSNLADPKNLYNFIKWGLETYPAEKYALIISGHGAPFLGILPDFSQDRPYLMGIPQMGEAIQQATIETGQRIDLLLLDVCYANYIEFMYELCRHEVPLVRYLLTYDQEGPLAGIDYNIIIEHLCRENAKENLDSVWQEIPDLLGPEVFVVVLEKEKLETVKQCAHTLAFFINLGKPEEGSPVKIDRKLLGELIYRQKKALRQSIARLTVYAQHNSSADQGILLLADRRTINRFNRRTYLEYAFCRNNDWAALFTQKGNRASDYGEIGFKPISMNRFLLLKYLEALNPEFPEKEQKVILRELMRIRKWRL